MTSNRITELETVLNQQVDDQENLSEYLSKAEALLQVALGNNFLEQSEKTIYDYIWALFDLVNSARELSEKLLSQLLRFSPSALLLDDGDKSKDTLEGEVKE